MDLDGENEEEHASDIQYQIPKEITKQPRTPISQNENITHNDDIVIVVTVIMFVFIYLTPSNYKDLLMRKFKELKLSIRSGIKYVRQNHIQKRIKMTNITLNAISILFSFSFAIYYYVRRDRKDQEVSELMMIDSVFGLTIGIAILKFLLISLETSQVAKSANGTVPSRTIHNVIIGSNIFLSVIGFAPVILLLMQDDKRIQYWVKLVVAIVSFGIALLKLRHPIKYLMSKNKMK